MQPSSGRVSYLQGKCSNNCTREYTLFKCILMFENKFNQISKRDVNDVHSHVLMVTVGIDVLLCRALALHYLMSCCWLDSVRAMKNMPDVAARGHKTNKNLELIRLLPLKLPPHLPLIPSVEGYSHTQAIPAADTMDKPVFKTEAKSPVVSLRRDSRRQGQEALGEQLKSGSAKALVFS
ncbi:hypothetical protein HPG69_000246 [Diceros bicornis minor]|uniref:Uncharacterized protein n=1 Tax=Diceros bicornis minor TaxID=77932 RepID=A0A7J7EUY1_DICBM|nr:hypothetical protein HPG69_000246 [Diceros bicornis minor]